MTTYVSEPVEIEVMQWEIDATVESGKEKAEKIVAWVNANGGDARYEPCVNLTRYDPHHGAVRPARIAVRTADGWRPAKPGDYIVKGDVMFKVPAPSDADANYAVTYHFVRDFYPVADLSEVRAKHQWRVK